MYHFQYVTVIKSVFYYKKKLHCSLYYRVPLPVLPVYTSPVYTRVHTSFALCVPGVYTHTFTHLHTLTGEVIILSTLFRVTHNGTATNGS